MSDLVSGRFPQQNPLWGIWGQQNNIAQSDVPMWTNAAPGSAMVATAAALKTAEITTVPIALPYGVEINKIGVRSTSASTEGGEHFFVALYSGLSTLVSGEDTTLPALLAQSKDATGATLIGKTETYEAELEKPVLVEPGNAPHGWLYVSLYAVASTAVPGLATIETAATALTKASSGAKHYPWFSGAPLPCFKTALSATGTAPAKLETFTLQAAAPVVFLK